MRRSSLKESKQNPERLSMLLENCRDYLRVAAKEVAISLAILIAMTGSSFATQNDLKIDGVHLTSCVNEGTCSTDSKDVILGDRVTLNLVVEATKDGEKVYFSNLDDITIGGKRIDPSLVLPWSFESALVRWYKVESKYCSYNNGSGEDFHWDTPSYEETLIDEGSRWTVIADAHPTDEFKDANGGLGTMRYKAEFTYRGRQISTLGKESVNLQGITDNVHRISFRKDDSFIGWLTSFFNLPYIYGSAGSTNEEHQTERYVGADCADLIVGAYRKAGHDIPYTYSGGLVAFADRIVREENLSTDGENYYDDGELLKWGEDIQEGDLILFGDWHVGVIVEDRGKSGGVLEGGADGILQEHDLMIHSFFDCPKEATIEGYGPFSVLRWSQQ